MSFENEYSKYLNSDNPEKTFIDKIMDRQDAEKFISIMKKPELTREDFLELQELVVGIENKLLNLDDHDSWTLGKYIVRINEAIDIAHMLFDYKKNVEDYNMLNKESIRGLDLAIQKIKKIIISSIYTINFMRRTSLSRNGKTIESLIEKGKELSYPNPYGMQYPSPPEKKGFFGRIFGGGNQ